MRKYRKQEHIENYLRSTHQGDALFCDVHLVHNSLPEMGEKDVDLSTRWLGFELAAPLMINAITGGSDFAQAINEDLAYLAKTFSLPMAVGSQTIALEDPTSHRSFQVVRDMMKGLPVFSNLSALHGLDEARRAVEILGADGIQIHLNPAQEMIMREGDRDFSQSLAHIAEIVEGIDVPVIVKEVGFGMSPSTVKSLYDVGVRCVDVAGFGGTNFFEVENLRHPEEDFSDLFDWGNPTTLCILGAKNLELSELTLVGSGGIRDAMDLVKSLVLGADMTAMSGEILSYLIHGGRGYAEEFLEQLLRKVRILMVLVGARNIQELKQAPYWLSGTLATLFGAGRFE